MLFSSTLLLHSRSPVNASIVLLTLPYALLALEQVQERAKEMIFEAASVKVNSSGLQVSEMNSASGRLTVRNLPVGKCIQYAYDVYQDVQFTGPEWLKVERIDIDAKAPWNASESELMAMFQALLVERFHLRFHTEMRELSVLGLVAAKGGLKVQKKVGVNDEAPGPTITLPHFAARLSNMKALRFDVPVVDMTGVEGEFKYKFVFRVDTQDSVELQARLGVALAEQLGLRLERMKTKVPIMVIDYMDKVPTPN